MSKTTLGVIGGLGPIATSYFMELIIKMTNAQTDQEHLDMIIYNCPSIPDRTSYILDKTKPNPLPPIIKIGKSLVENGADNIAIPCITAHYFYETLAREISVPIVDIVSETVKHLKKNGISRVGIMATDGTVTSGLFQKALENNGMKALLPQKKCQEYVMDLIYGCVKAGKPIDMEKFGTVKAELKKMGAEAIILGCTELSLIKREYDMGEGFIDAMEVLARQSILRCGGTVKPEYDCLITH